MCVCVCVCVQAVHACDVGDSLPEFIRSQVNKESAKIITYVAALLKKCHESKQPNTIKQQVDTPNYPNRVPLSRASESWHSAAAVPRAATCLFVFVHLCIFRWTRL